MITRETQFGSWVLAVPVMLVLLAGVASALPDVLPKAGTVGTRLSIRGFGFGETKGKASLVDATTGATTTLKVVTWTPSEVLADIPKMPKTGFMEYTVSVTPKGGDYIRMFQTFTFSQLQLTSVSVESGVPGDAVTIQGSYFGVKPGKVALGYNNPKKPGLLFKSCKVGSWVMDPVTNASTAVVLVPRMAPGTYTLYVDNKISNATWSNPFEVLSLP